MKPSSSTELGPLTTTEHSQLGPNWPAEMALPSPPLTLRDIGRRGDSGRRLPESRKAFLPNISYIASLTDDDAVPSFGGRWDSHSRQLRILLSEQFADRLQLPLESWSRFRVSHFSPLRASNMIRETISWALPLSSAGTTYQGAARVVVALRHASYASI